MISPNLSGIRRGIRMAEAAVKESFPYGAMLWSLRSMDLSMKMVQEKEPAILPLSSFHRPGLRRRQRLGRDDELLLQDMRWWSAWPEAEILNLQERVFTRRPSSLPLAPQPRFLPFWGTTSPRRKTPSLWLLWVALD
jgi:hypothetical protein